MSTRTLAKISAAFHLQYGVGLLLSPERNAAVWVGRRAARQGSVKVLGQALGVRDLVLGAGALLALQRDDRAAARAVLAAMIATDGIDVVATALADDLPLPSRAATLAFAAGCTAADVAYVAAPD